MPLLRYYLTYFIAFYTASITDVLEEMQKNLDLPARDWIYILENI